jgi:WD40 repeat protein
MKNIIFIVLYLLVSQAISGQILKPTSKFTLDIDEVSDLLLHPNGVDYVVTTDNGELYVLDSTFTIQYKSEFEGDDFEGLCLYKNNIYVSEDRDRQLVVFEPEKLVLVRAFTVPFQMRNGDQIEGMTTDREGKNLILFSEEKPIEIFIYSPETHEHEVRTVEELPEIASLDFYGNRLFALSDESPELLELNPSTFQIMHRWRIRVNNAEGICIRNHKIYVVSDELRRAFQFEIPQP